MTKKNNIKYTLFSLVWAGLMLASAYVVEDQKQAAIMLFLLIGGWASTGGLASEKGFSTAKQEWACLKRQFQRLKG